MTRHLLAKVRPLDADTLEKTRDRKQIPCPFCGRTYRLGWLARWLARGIRPVTCKSCEVVFMLHMDPDFDPSVPVGVGLDSTRGVNCKTCGIGFRMRHRYEQCPSCGQLIVADRLDGEVKLVDNSAEVGVLLAEWNASRGSVSPR